MKNMKKYIACFIFLSFSLMMGVYASPIEWQVGLPKGVKVPIDLSDYNGVTCEENVDNRTEIVKDENSGQYYVQWKANEDQNTSGSENLVCTFETSPHIPLSAKKEDKTIKIDVKYGVYKTVYSVELQLYKGYFDTVNLIDDNGFNHFPFFQSIVQVRKITGGQYDSGKDYIDIDCPVDQSTKCIVSLKDNLPSDDSLRWAMYQIEYKNDKGTNNVVEFTFKILSDKVALAYPGAYGTCKFGDEWNYSSNHYISSVKNDKVNLPTCNSDKSQNPFITFYGWVVVDDFETDRASKIGLNVCKDHIVVNSGEVAHEVRKNSYYPCYVSTGGILLNPNGGKVNELENYTIEYSSYKGEGDVDIQYQSLVYIKQDGMIELPNIVELPKQFANGTFEGWLELGGTERIYKAGESVAANGANYVAIFGSGKTVVGEDTDHKMVFVGENISYKTSGSVIKNCTSVDSEKVNAHMSNGECVIQGVKSTDNEYIDVIVLYSDGVTRNLKVRVVSRTGAFGDDWDTIILEEPDVSPDDSGDGNYENISGADVCDTYLVSNSGKNSGAVATDKNTGFGLSITQYTAKSKCGDGKNYLALCMDPGRPGPRSSDIYEIDTSFNPENEFGKLVSHIVKKFVEEGENDTTITAANIALRSIEYYSTEELANSNSGGNAYLANALKAYKAMGSKLKSACPDLTKCGYSEIYDTLGKAWNWSNDNVRKNVATFLAGYTNDEVGSSEIQNKSSRKGTYLEGDEFIYQIEYSGELTFPTGMTVLPSDIVVDCGNVPGVSNCVVQGEFLSEKVYSYKFTYDIDLRNTGFYIPKTTDDVNPSIKINTNNTVTTANVFVIKTLNNNKQRMVIFNTEPVALRLHMPIYMVCDINKAPFKSDDPGFRYDLFREAGCCQFVLDETSEVFKTYCTADCIQSNFAMMCNPNYTVGDNSEIDVYSIDEAYKAGASGTKELNYACIVDVSGGSSAINKTNQLKDSLGNSYVVVKGNGSENGASSVSYTSNQYCAVSCKENWDISTASFENFVGQNAVAAGQYFSISHDIFIGSARTCVTTYIDYNLYKQELTNLSKDLTTAWKTYSEYSKVYSVLEASIKSETKKYYTYSLNGSSDCDCDENGENCSVCYDWSRTEHDCEVYTISTDTSDTAFDSANWNGQYATSVTGYISTSSLGGAAGGGKEIHTDWESGSVAPSKYSSSKEGYDGYCKSEQDAEYLMKVVTYNGNVVRDHIDAQRGIISDARSQISKKAEDMTLCQNFVLKNTSTKENNEFNVDSSNIPSAYNSRPTISGFTQNYNNVSIPTKFEPTAKYEYPEKEFTQILGNDNVIVNDIDVNKAKLEAAGKNYDTFNNDCITLSDRKDSKGNNIELCKNKLTTLTYQSNTPWAVGSESGKTYGENLTGTELQNLSLSEFKITLCYVNDSAEAMASGGDSSSYGYSSHGNCQWDEGIVVYYPVNYIKQTLENGSFYKNKGVWVQEKFSDVKDHVEKFSNLNSSEAEEWSIFGAKNNTFPISLTTPKNIYQYAYYFYDIGYYYDGTTGRIMGGQQNNSLIVNNRHACFYEVYEDVCICCGDPITWTVYGPSRLEETKEYLNNEGYPNDYSGSNLTNGYSGKDAKLGLAASSVSLYDLTGGTNRTLYSNWTSNDLFVYLTKIYKTDKGATLASHIVNKGEKIYDTATEVPEYSYTLTTSMMATIRDSMDDNIYGFESGRYDLVGISNQATPFDNKITTVDDKVREEYSTFSHFRSKFLREELKDYITPEFKGKTLAERNSKVCSVKASSTAADEAYKLVQTGGCSWVDYVQTTSDGQEIRLAFK